MVKSYSRKRTKEELIESFRQAVKRKSDWLKAHNLEALNVAEA